MYNLLVYYFCKLLNSNSIKTRPSSPNPLFRGASREYCVERTPKNVHLPLAFTFAYSF